MLRIRPSRLLPLCALLLAGALLPTAKVHARAWFNTQVKLPDNTGLGDIDGDGFSDYVQAVGAYLYVNRVDAAMTRLVAAPMPTSVQRIILGGFSNINQKDEVCVVANGQLRCYAYAAGGTLTQTSNQINFISADEEIMVGDFDADGLADLLLYAPSTGALRMYRRPAGGTFTAMANFTLGNLASVDLRNKQIRIGNFGQGSSQSDLVFLNAATGQVHMYHCVKSGGNITFWWAFRTSTGQVGANEEFTVANVNGDNTEDVVLHDRVTGAYRFFHPTYLNGRLRPLDNVAQGALSAAAGAQLLWGRFFPAGSDVAPLRDDALVYITGPRSVNVVDARQSSGSSTLDYVAGFTGYVPFLAPDLAAYLQGNTAIANAIKWQIANSCYVVTDAQKKAWPAWSSAEKTELATAFEASWTWYFRTPAPLTNLLESITYPPVNVYPDVAIDTASPSVFVTPTYARTLYIAWIAHQLLAELGKLVPWSLASLNADGQLALLDSASYMTFCSGSWALGSDNPWHPNYVSRKDNIGSSLIAPPRYTFAFLKNNNLLGASRYDTIVRVLNWSSDNLTHFINDFTYKNMFDHWQYRGLPPITRIIEGTTAPFFPNFAHWTAGCHGSTGFYRNVLRAANVPMYIMNRCQHSLAYFISENLYLDHGDDPYNSTFVASGESASALLIDQTTFDARFGASVDNTQTGCSFVGWEATH
jgi:hypothetical protein